jgi:hypothetical protein
MPLTRQKNPTIPPVLPSHLLVVEAVVVVVEAEEAATRPTNPDPLRHTRHHAPRWAHPEAQETQALQAVAVTATATVTAMVTATGTATVRTEETTQDASTAA